MSYRMELWDVLRPGAAIDQVLVQAADIVSGIHGLSVFPAYVLSRSIKRSVMLSDLGILPAQDMCRLAHARHRNGTHWQTLRRARAAQGTRCRLYMTRSPLRHKSRNIF